MWKQVGPLASSLRDARLAEPLRAIALGTLALVVLVLIREVSPIGVPDVTPPYDLRAVDLLRTDFIHHVGLVLCELLVLLPAWRHAPERGTLRIMVLVAAVLVASVTASAARAVWLLWTTEEPIASAFPIIVRRVLFLTGVVVFL